MKSKIGLILELNFNEYNIKDESIYGVQIINSGSTWVLKGRNFDGAGNYIDAESINVTSKFTIEGWIKIPVNSNTSNKELVNLSASTAPPFFSPHYKNIQNKPYIGLNDLNARFGSRNLADNIWHHIVFIVNGMSVPEDINNTQIYIDGIEVSYGTSTTIDSPAPTSGKAWIGSGNFKGIIGNIRIWNRILSYLEIQQIYQEEKTKVGC